MSSQESVVSALESAVFIRSVWPLFKGAKTEKILLFYMDEGSLNHIDITEEGTAFQSDISLKKVRDALTILAGRDVILAHNHPFNLPQPSKKDIEATGFLGSLLALCGIRLTDHLIVSPYGHFSFRNNEIMESFIPIQTTETAAEATRTIHFRQIARNDSTILPGLMKQYGELLIGRRRIICARSFSGLSLLNLMLDEPHGTKDENGCIYIINSSNSRHADYVRRIINPRAAFVFHPTTRNLVPIPQHKRREVPKISTGKSLINKLKFYFPAPYRAFHGTNIMGH
ncbi:JAB domain-containing protein [Bhargavaea cecembensis]|uniref:JAB domain-containing protein n=1 Tax=Bhargavaea cecembensis TaxID=394098 RepID=UPI0009EE221A|nr:JAB domain-containing protein [Bhargavaea cecembensis]